MKNNVYIRLILRLSNTKKLFFIGVVCIMIIAAFDAVLPLIYTWTIDNIIAVKKYELLTPFVIFFIIFSLLFVLVIFTFMSTLGKLENKFSQQLRNELFEKIQKLHMDYFIQNDEGWIIARITGDVTKLADVMSWQFIDVLYFMFMFGFIFVLVFIYNVTIGIILLLMYPILVFLIYIVRNKVLKNYRLVRKQNSIMTSKYNELINGIHTIKTMSIEENDYRDFDGYNKKMYKYSKKALTTSALFAPITIIFGYLIYAVILDYSGVMFSEGLMTVGVLTAIMSYILILIESTNELTAILAEFQNAQANAERIFTLLDEEIKIEDSDYIKERYGTIFDDIKTTKINGDVKFKDIHFKYPNGVTLFDGLNLEVKSGQKVALVGETGSGKTSIINLLTRLYEVESGEILIDDINIYDRNINFVHHNIGHVLQRPQLFKGTIKENICYNKEISDEQINNIIDLLGMREMINIMPNGIDTEIGESGSRLSVGQKQLISFARAIISDPQIIIMDEATSSIDTETEQLIQKATEKLLQNRTSFIIAHRLSTIKNCDLIVVLKKGVIMEQGTHDELMDKKGYYYKLNTV